MAAARAHWRAAGYRRGAASGAEGARRRAAQGCQGAGTARGGGEGEAAGKEGGCEEEGEALMVDPLLHRYIRRPIEVEAWQNDDLGPAMPVWLKQVAERRLAGVVAIPISGQDEHGQRKWVE